MLTVQNLSKRFGKKQVLNDISFNAKKGEVTALIGVNGIGKTTIMNCIAGLLPFDKGKVTIDDMPARKVFAEKVSYITDSSIISPDQTVDEAIDFMRTFYPNWNRQKERHLLDFFHLNLKDEVRSLSKGNVAKLNLLLGMGLNTDYILMDEPFSALDPLSKVQLQDLIKTLHNEYKMTTVFVTHDMDEAMKLADRICVLKEGKVVQIATPEVLKENPADDFVREFFARGNK